MKKQLNKYISLKTNKVVNMCLITRESKNRNITVFIKDAQIEDQEK